MISVKKQKNGVNGMAKNEKNKKKKVDSSTIAVRVMCIFLGVLMLGGAVAMIINYI